MCLVALEAFEVMDWIKDNFCVLSVCAILGGGVGARKNGVGKLDRSMIEFFVLIGRDDALGKGTVLHLGSFCLGELACGL